MNIFTLKSKYWSHTDTSEQMRSSSWTHLSDFVLNSLVLTSGLTSLSSLRHKRLFQQVLVSWNLSVQIPGRWMDFQQCCILLLCFYVVYKYLPQSYNQYLLMPDWMRSFSESEADSLTAQRNHRNDTQLSLTRHVELASYYNKSQAVAEGCL